MLENKTPNHLQAVKKKCRYKKNGYAVNNEELLYHIADAGLLCKLHGVKAAPVSCSPVSSSKAAFYGA